MAYIGVSPSNGVRRKHTYTATAAQTDFTGAGAEGITLRYLDSNYIDVYQNGVKLSEADYTSTSGDTIVLAETTVSDIIEIVVYDVFSVADTVSKSAGGTFDGNVTMAGTLDVTGVATATTFEPDGDTAAGDNAAIGYTAAEGLILTGQGSTSDITVKNDADATVFTVPTGTDDILFPDNAKILMGADSDLQIFHDGSNSNIDDAGTGPLRISSNGTGIDFNKGTSETMAKFKTDGAVELYHNAVKKIETAATGVTSAGTYIGTVAGSASAPNFAITSGSLGANGIFVPAANTLAFSNAGTERMRIDSGARLAFGNTDTNAKITVSQNGNALNLMRLQNTDGTDNARFVQFANDSNSDCGHIDQVNATTIAYNTTSDYRLKQNVAYTFDATTEVKKLKPCTFSWKHDATDKSVYGFLAHEVSGIVSEAVSGTKDATRDIGTIKNEDGEITAKNAPQVQANTDENETWEKTDTENVYQGYDAGKLVPLLVKTIQELEARITALENA